MFVLGTDPDVAAYPSRPILCPQLALVMCFPGELRSCKQPLRPASWQAPGRFRKATQCRTLGGHCGRLERGLGYKSCLNPSRGAEQKQYFSCGVQHFLWVWSLAIPEVAEHSGRRQAKPIPGVREVSVSSGRVAHVAGSASSVALSGMKG